MSSQISPYVLVNFAGLGSGLLSNLFLARFFSIHEYAIYALYLVYANIVSVLIEIGIGQNIGQNFERNIFTRKEVKVLVSAINLVVLTLSLIPLIYFTEIDKSFFGWLYCVPFVVYLTEYTDRYIGHDVFTGFNNNIHKMLILLFIVLIPGYVSIRTVFLLQAFILVLIHLLRFLRYYSDFSFKRLKLAIAPNGIVWISRCLSTLSNQGDKILVSLFLSKETYATYSFASTLILPAGAFLQVRSNELFVKLEKMTQLHLLRKLLLPVLLIGFIVPVFYLIFLQKYFQFSVNTVLYFSFLLMIGYVFQCLYQRSMSLFLRQNKVNVMLKINMLSTSLTYLLILFFVLALGVHGIVSFSFLFTSFFVFILYFLYER